MNDANKIENNIYFQSFKTKIDDNENSRVWGKFKEARPKSL